MANLDLLSDLHWWGGAEQLAAPLVALPGVPPFGPLEPPGGYERAIG